MKTYNQNGDEVIYDKERTEEATGHQGWAIDFSKGTMAEVQLLLTLLHQFEPTRINKILPTSQK